MVRKITDSPYETGIQLSIRHSIIQYPMKLWISQEDTILDLKEFIGHELEHYNDEITFIVNLSYPYPLPDHMRLYRLSEEHRHLILRVHEGKEECYGDPHISEKSAPWWGNECAIPDRYFYTLEDGTPIFDFRYLTLSQLILIRSWIYSYQNVSEVWVLGTHPFISKILHALAEDILSFTSLKRIVIHHPLDISYSLPPHSERRHRDLHHNGIISYLTREPLIYLYQHLLLDQYRDSADEISVIIHGGLLDDHPETFRFLLNN